MTTVEKTYTGFGNQYTIRFNYNESVATIDDNFEVTDFAGKGFGVEDQDELATYPSNSTIILSNLFATNFDAFDKLISSYSQVLPYNYNSTLTIEVSKNGSQYFFGIVDNLEYDFANYELRVDVVDAVAQYKNFSIDNYQLLDFLHNSGIPGRSPINFFVPGNDFTGCYAWGADAKIAIDQSGSNRLWLKRRTDTQCLTTLLIQVLLKSIDSNTNVTVDIDWLFGSRTSLNYEFVAFNGTFLGDIIQSLFGILIQKRKDFVIAFLDKPDLDGIVVGTQFHKYPFKKVYDDGTYETWYYDEPNPSGINLRKVSEILKMFCRQFFAEYGFTSYNESYFRKKADRDLSDAVDLDGLVIGTPQKEIFRRAKKSVSVVDRFYNPDGSVHYDVGQWGEQDNPDDKLEFDIWFSYAIRTIPLVWSDITYPQSNFSYYDSDGVKRAITTIKDPVTGLQNKIPLKIAESEYAWNNFNKKRYSLELSGVDYSYLDIYKMTDEDNRIVYLKPVTMAIDETEQKTKMEAINIKAVNA